MSPEQNRKQPAASGEKHCTVPKLEQISQSIISLLVDIWTSALFFNFYFLQRNFSYTVARLLLSSNLNILNSSKCRIFCRAITTEIFQGPNKSALIHINPVDFVACLNIYTTQYEPMREMSTQTSTIKNMVFNLVNAISAYLHSTQICLFHLYTN